MVQRQHVDLVEGVAQGRRGLSQESLDSLSALLVAVGLRATIREVIGFGRGSAQHAVQPEWPIGVSGEGGERAQHHAHPFQLLIHVEKERERLVGQL